MIVELLTGALIGGIGVCGKNIISTIFKKEDVDSSMSYRSIPGKTWEDIWYYNKVYVQEDKETFFTPYLLEEYEMEDGSKYFFKLPMGLVTSDLLKCETQIKELFGVEEVKIYHYKENTVMIELIPVKEQKKIDWEDMWKACGVSISDREKKEVLTPTMLGSIRDSLDNPTYKIKAPLGVSLAHFTKSKEYLKDYLQARDIKFESLGEGRFSMSIIYNVLEEEGAMKEGSIPNERWSELWKEIKICTGKEGEGLKLPKFISETNISGGKSYLFELPIGKSSYHLDKQDITIREFLEARSVELIAVGKNRIEIKAIFDEIPSKIPFKLIPRTAKDSFELFIGEHIDGFARLDFRTMANVLDAGMQGSGKSVVTKGALTYCGCMYDPSELEIYIADLKRTELGRFRNMKSVKRYVETAEDTNEMIKDLLDIMDDRYRLFSERGVSDAYEFNKKFPEEKMPYIFVVIEEMSRYTSNTSLKNLCKQRGENDQNEKLAELLFNGRACSLSTWLTVQRPTQNNLSPDVKSSMGNTLAFQTMNSLNSRIICDSDDKLKHLRGKGHGYLINETGEREMQSFWISNDDIERLLEEHNALKK